MWEIAFLVLFFASTGVHLYASWVENKKLSWSTKPLLMPLLALYYVTSGAAVDWLVLAGVFLGFLGDVFLLKEGDEKMFLLGLVSFLLGHLFYVAAFLLSIQAGSSQVNYLALLVLLPFALYMGLYLRAMKEPVGEMFVPVVVYASVITVMSLSALLRATAYASAGGWLVFLGSLLFVASDSVLAVNAFNDKVKVPKPRVITMSTYILAQFFIVLGFVLA
ncbi:MAG: lysoplasmalogenase [Promethearchaeota archaeon]